MRGAGWLLVLMTAAQALAQPPRTFVLGEAPHSWESGGNGLDPVVVRNAFQGWVDTSNAPGGAIGFGERPGWIGLLRFAEHENIAARVLEFGSISAPNAGRGLERQLQGTINGDHLVAFERKPTLFEPQVLTRGVFVLLDFGVPVGVHRVRFYPRNTVVPAPAAPFHNDFLRGYEVWINRVETSAGTPETLVARRAENEQPVADIAIEPQYVRFLKIKSIAEAPFEIDEIEVYGTGYLQEGTYLSDLIDLGGRATVGPLRWVEEAEGPPQRSALSLRARSGADDTPLLYRRLVDRAEPLADTLVEVSAREYFALERLERARLEEDVEKWSAWQTVENGALMQVPGPRRYAQFRLHFTGDLFATRQVRALEFEYLVPPIADSLRAEIYPRLAEAEKRATFRYAVRLRNEGQARGFDRLEVDTNIEVAQVRSMRLDGEVFDFEVESIDADGFALRFAPVRADGAVLEFTFDMPVFRFGTTFSGRVSDSRWPQVPQALEPGNVLRFEPGDEDALSGLSVAIPRPQIGRLVGQIALASRVFTPNGDGVNDLFEMSFNVLQLTRAVPLSVQLFDLAGRRVGVVLAQERGIGPVEVRWDGRLRDGERVLPGTYVWVLEVRADAFVERHSGVLGVAY